MKLTPKTLSAAAQSFGIGISALRPLGGMEGLACEFKRRNKLYVLKIVRADEKNPDQVQQIHEKLTFINYLAENGVRVTPPIPSPAGNWIESIKTEEGRFLVTAAPKAPGKHADLYDPRNGTPGFFQAWGKVTGQMHALAKEYPIWQKKSEDGATISTVTDWKSEHEFFASWCQFDNVRDKWIELGEKLNQLPRTREGFGFIHNDLHPWNFLVDDGRITVIDFDVSAYHWFIKDIAIALFFANWNGNPGKSGSKDEYLTTFLRNFMTGYTTENQLDSFWFTKLPLFLKHHQILLYIVFTDEWKTPNKWQIKTLKKWERQILNDSSVVTLIF